MSKLIFLPLFFSNRNASIVLNNGVKIDGNAEGFVWLNPSHIVSVAQVAIERLNPKAYVTLEEISKIPSTSNERTQFQRMLEDGELLEYNGGFYRYNYDSSIRILTLDGHSFFTPMKSWKQFHIFWTSDCGLEFLNAFDSVNRPSNEY